MDEDIRAALTELKADIKDGFRDTKERIDSLVTKSEFDATVTRIDAQHNALREAYEKHDQGSPGRLEAIRADVKSQFAEARTSTRWAVGLAIPATGLLIAGGQWLLALAGN